MRSTLRTDLLTWLAFASCLFWLFSPGLVYSQVPAFRDGFHFYYPQAVWLDQCVAGGERFPRWNPNEGLGVSVSGQPSSALYYPLRCLWWLPLLSLPQRYACVLVAHLVIAAAGIKYAARGLRLSSAASWLAAFSYALSCPVIFQHTNLIYLCSAAWIGFALGAFIRILRCGEGQWLRSCVVFTVACSLMMLGGDPQTMVNMLIVAFAGTVASIALDWPGATTEPPQPMHRSQSALRLLSWLTIACLMISIFTAVQWIPALHWSALSSRFDVPELRITPAEELSAALNAAADTQRHIYDFSLSPWHVVSLIWPTLGGQYLPDHSRIFAAIASEGRMWVPSIYIGCLPGWLALSAVFCPRFISPASRSLAVLMAAAFLAALGNYSVIWLLRECLFAFGLDELAGRLPKDHVASLYWLLTESLPGYAAFRYPAKWVVWIAAAGSLLAAEQLKNCMHRQSKRQNHWPITLMLGLSWTGLIVSATCWLFAASGSLACVDRWLATVAMDPLLGAPSVIAVARNCTVAFAIPSLLLFMHARLKLSANAITWLTLAEMTLIASHWVVFAPAPEPPMTPIGPDLSSPFLWSKNIPNRVGQAKVVGKLGLLSSARWLNASQSLEPVELDRLTQWLANHDNGQTFAPQLDRVLAELGVTHRLVDSLNDTGGVAAEWQAIANARPLCEFRGTNSEAGDNANLSAASVQWSWQSNSALRVNIDSPVSGVLIVRQLNDGGWTVESPLKGAAPPLASNTLFIQLPIAAGVSSIIIRRKWLW